MLAADRSERRSAAERASRAAAGSRRSTSAPTTAGCWWRSRRGDGFHVVDSFSRIVRLGEGLAATGRLSEPAMARTLAALKVCRRIMDRHRVARVRCVATEACRRAAQRAGVHPPGPSRHRHRARGAGPGRGGAAGHARLPAADRPRGRPAPDARHRRRQHRDHVARPPRAARRARARPHPVDAAGRGDALGELRRRHRRGGLRARWWRTRSTQLAAATGCRPRRAATAARACRCWAPPAPSPRWPRCISACAATTAARSTASRCRSR